MKNLILPFVVVVLFAVGSCGDEASINPPVDGKDTTKTQDTTKNQDTIPKVLNITKAVVHITGIPVLLEEHTYVNDNSPLGNRHDSVQVERIISYQDTLMNQQVEIKGDTVIISMLDSAFSSQQDYSAPGTIEYTDIKSSTIKIILDTNNAEASLLHYSSQLVREHILKTPNPMKMNYGTTVKNKTFTLKNVKYVKKDEAFIFHLQPISQSIFTEFFVNQNAYRNTRDGGQTTYASSGEYSIFKNLLPFITESNIYIELK